MKKILLVVIFTFFFATRTLWLFAQTVSEVGKIESGIEREKALRERIERKEEKPLIEEKPIVEEAPPKDAETVFIKKINVTGATLLSEKKSRILFPPLKIKKSPSRKYNGSLTCLRTRIVKKVILHPALIFLCRRLHRGYWR